MPPPNTAALNVSTVIVSEHPLTLSQYAEAARRIKIFTDAFEYPAAFEINLAHLDDLLIAKELFKLSADEMGIIRCHGCEASEKSDGAPCGWAYLICRRCQRAFCSWYFLTWCVRYSLVRRDLSFYRDFGRVYWPITFDNGEDDGDDTTSACGEEGGTLRFRHGRKFTCLTCMDLDCVCDKCSPPGSRLQQPREVTGPAHPFYGDCDFFAGNVYNVAYDCRHTTARFPKPRTHPRV